MDSQERARLAGELAAAEADIARLRAENAELAAAFREEPTDARKDALKRAATSLHAARDRADAARAALEVFDKTGSPHGLVAEGGRVVGSIAVQVKPGATREEREQAIEAALSEALARAAAELGVVLGARPERYTRERPGRDTEGRTVLEIAGRVEGDVLMPAVSRAAKNVRVR